MVAFFFQVQNPPLTLAVEGMTGFLFSFSCIQRTFPFPQWGPFSILLTCEFVVTKQVNREKSVNFIKNCP